MPKTTPERRIDLPSGAGRTSDYVAGATAAAGLIAHTHDGTANSGGVLAGYALAVHGHAWADITSGVPDFATRWPTWSEVTSKPTTFAPSAHNHAASDINSGILSPATGGTGVDNGTKTLTVQHSMTLSGADGRTLTIPDTGTAALREVSNTFTTTQLIVVDQGNAEIQGFTYRDTPSAAFFRANKARGTLAAPTVLQSGDLIGGFLGNGYTGANFITSAQIGLYADGDMSTNRLPGRVDLMTSDGTAGTIARLSVKGNGNILIGTTIDKGQVAIDQSSSTATEPVLYLRQADLSEEFIRFDATVGAGNPIDTGTLGGYYGKIRVHVEGVGAKWIPLHNS